MIEQLNNIDTIYDLFALCSSYILNQLKFVKYEFGLFDDEKYNDVYDTIERYCCEKEESGKEAAFEEVRSFAVDYFQMGISIERCFAFIKYIDDLVEVEINGKLIGGDGITPYFSLNTQYIDQVRVLPKIRSTFVSRGDSEFKMQNQSACSLLRKKRECACSVLDMETLNYMIWDADKIAKYPTIIYHVDERSCISRHFMYQDKIVFGIVPVTCKKLDEILDVRYERKTFHIERMYEDAEKELEERYADVFSRSIIQEIDFLIFPEMLMTDEMICNGERKFAPQIIVNGSVWKDFENRTVVTDGEGKEIFCYHKKTPYRLKREDKYIAYPVLYQFNGYTVIYGRTGKRL